MFNRLNARNRYYPWLLALMLTALPGIAAAMEAPITIKVLSQDFDVQADGLYTETTHFEVSASNDAAAKQIGQRAIQYSESMEELDILEAYTLKADGQKLSVDPNAIFPQLPPGSAQVPMFNDMRQKIVVFPDVAGGDTVVITYKRRLKQARFPGAFMDEDVFQRGLAYQGADITVRAPKALPLTTAQHDVSFEKQTKGETVTYHWHYSAPDAVAEDIAALSPYDRLPRRFVSSFKTYDDLGHAYWRLAGDKIVVSPKVQSLADEITTGVTDPRERAQKIYEWVSKHIRYVAIFLENGGLVPHDPDTVLTNAYGDCKDHTVLFASLLKAKGINSEIVLINLGNSYALPEAPTLATLNHAITWLPQFGLYADTTVGVAPFGALPFSEYGKPVVHAVPQGQVLRETPLLAPGAANVSFKTTAHLDEAGKLSGDSITEATGPFSISLRQLGAMIQSVGSEQSAVAILKRYGVQGTGKFELPIHPDQPTPTYTIASHEELEPRSNILSGAGFPIPAGMRTIGFTGDTLMGPLFAARLPDTEPTPCYSGHAVEDLSLEPPPKMHFVKLPSDTTVKTPNLEFAAHWTFIGGTVSVHREFTSKMETALCVGEVRKATAVALGQIRENFPTQISLAPD